ncbi:sigma-70 family RNA polymerase sigma factor [Rhodococcus oryzae]|uniref:Sigma-70 family RNA polymerase sigma factor n=1 Tax=Rhodococcus oryzae TaxID=2571143 RepID=A0ABY2RDM3_9NOCA|nr:sigma-70 family RNA polymerase sigma factor [Rhodococcus oryzae]TJZ73631.1 sigma-70 family RNA polymerase sigma factor [Rhodococcus oryzae]
MGDQDELAQRFESERSHLRAVAYRMLGSLSEADDAVQEAWLRLSRADVSEVEDLAAWLRTVVARLCLDMLRSRKSRREDPAGQQVPDRFVADVTGSDPENEALLADSVGRALLVVLDRLVPVERIVFVLHDMFAVPFSEIAPIVGRTPVATKKVASRARLRVQGVESISRADLGVHRHIVEAFLAASRSGDLNALLAVLAPDVVRTADPAALPAGAATVARGARAVVEGVMAFGRRARFAEAALVDGAVGVIVAPRGRLLLALTFAIEDDRIAEYEVIADPVRLSELDLAVLAK